jgi:hypothetical protein
MNWMSISLLLISALLISPTRLVAQDTSTVHYFIRVNPEAPPANLTEPYWTASVMAITTAETTEVIPPAGYSEVSASQLASMGYQTPEESYAEAAAQGYAVDYETDGLGKKSWINVTQVAQHLYRVQYGSATGRNPLPGPLGLGYQSYYNGNPINDWPYPNGFYEPWGWHTQRYRNYLMPPGLGVQKGRHHWGNRNEVQYTQVTRRWP